MSSPLDYSRSLSAMLGVELYVKRDDLLPFPLPGNKFRKVTRHLMDARAQPGDIVISVGGIRSNHCRTVAMLATQHQLTARLVLHSKDPEADDSSLAAGMLRALGADLHLVDVSAVADTVQRLERQSTHPRARTHVIPGGCHSKAGVLAYADAVGELIAQFPHGPDVIVLPTGTGATQAGIIAGCVSRGWSTRVIGISVARSADRGTASVREAVRWVVDWNEEVDFRDSWTAGGYEMVAESTRRAVARGWANGLPLDHTYTGKAFDGLTDLVGAGEIEKGRSTVFWHTGGLGNFLEDLSMQSNLRP